MKTYLQRHNSPMPPFLIKAMLKGPKSGAYTELFAGLSPDATMDHTGAFLLPWERFDSVPDYIEDCLKTEERGGNGRVRKFVKWCEQATEPYL
ncbi:MAG: hypothetical protein MMC23_001016 [Stictis urceolatum]|nr:hypothetical protein [Stictis urceolata]